MMPSDETTRREWMLSRIHEIIEENAALLGEEPEIDVRLRDDGVRIQVRKNGRWVRGEYRHYPTMESAFEAALTSNENAHRVAQRRVDAARGK